MQRLRFLVNLNLQREELFAAFLDHRRSLLDRKLLNAMIERVNHVKIALAIESQSVRSIELAGADTLFRNQPAQVLAFRRELLHAATDGADPEAIIPVDAQADGTDQTSRLSILVSQ